MTAPGVHIDSRDREHADQPVAVIFAGLADAVGREAGGTPAVLEHRTGASANSLHLEPELYARWSVINQLTLSGQKKILPTFAVICVWAGCRRGVLMA